MVGIIIIVTNFESFILGDVDWNFIPEIALRTLIMYLILLFSLRMLGKRGVKQLSVFELVVIISLGSAAGDPMFYKEVGLLSALTVFVVIVISYKLTSFLVNRSKKAEQVLEGKATYLIENGMFAIENFKKETLAQDEFFSELRIQGVSHLGQVELAIIETSGSVSLFYYSDDQVKYGLPILPHLFCDKLTYIQQKSYYSCSFCGFTSELGVKTNTICPRCKKSEWVKSLNGKRI